jgi:hypothetical protein
MTYCVELKFICSFISNNNTYELNFSNEYECIYNYDLNDNNTFILEWKVE